jgi:DNA-binding MarR family transcriptional regulator
MKITIKGFSKYNPRSDLKSMPWLRLQNNFYDNEDFYDEDYATRYLFVFLLCLCAQKVSDTVDFDIHFLLNKANMKKSEFLDALSKLKAKGLIMLETNESDRIRSETCLTNERTERREQHGRASRENSQSLFSEEIKNLWNSDAKRMGMPEIKDLSPARKKKLETACKSFKELDDWHKIFNVAASKSFVDSSGKTFIPNWDYIFRNDNYLSFYESYDQVFNTPSVSSESLTRQFESSILGNLP